MAAERLSCQGRRQNFTVGWGGKHRTGPLTAAPPPPKPLQSLRRQGGWRPASIQNEAGPLPAQQVRVDAVRVQATPVIHSLAAASVDNALDARAKPFDVASDAQQNLWVDFPSLPPPPLNLARSAALNFLRAAMLAKHS